MRPLPESRTLGLPCLENMYFRRKEAVGLAEAKDMEEASTHFVRCSIASKINLCPPKAMGNGPTNSILTTWKGEVGERILCWKWGLGPV